MTNTKNNNDLCKICHIVTYVGNNFGAISCNACAAFFRRSVRSKCTFECKQDRIACGDSAIKDVTSNHACKKCRLDRCQREGMKECYVRAAESPKEDKTPSEPSKKIAKIKSSQIFQTKSKLLDQRLPNADNEFPMLSAMVKAIRKMNIRCQAKRSKQVVGTSEIGDNYLDFSKCQQFAMNDIQGFRMLMNELPVVGKCSEERKNCIFNNSMSILLLAWHSYSDIQQKDDSKETRRYHPYPNVYIDFDFAKVLRLKTSLKCFDKQKMRVDDLRFVAQQFIKIMNYVKNEISEFFKIVVHTEEDFAALFYILIISSNEFGKSNGKWQRSLKSLKKVFLEVDKYYRKQNRDPSCWGNLLFMASSFRTLLADLEFYIDMLYLVYGTQVFDHGDIAKLKAINLL